MELVVWAKIYREKFEVEEGCEEGFMLALVKSGSFYLKINDSEYTVQKGQAAIFYPDQHFCRKVIDPLTMYLFRFKTRKSIFHNPKIVFKDAERINSTLRFLEQLDMGMYHNDFFYRKSLFNDIMTQVLLESSTPDFPEGEFDQLVQEAKRIFEQYLHEKCVLTETAQKLGISYVHFIRRFKRITGIAPSEYLARIRLERAKGFLAKTEIPIKEIAPKCGYENEYYFSNVFKKYTGMPPSEFRKKITRV